MAILLSLESPHHGIADEIRAGLPVELHDRGFGIFHIEHSAAGVGASEDLAGDTGPDA